MNLLTYLLTYLL